MLRAGLNMSEKLIHLQHTNDFDSLRRWNKT